MRASPIHVCALITAGALLGCADHGVTDDFLDPPPPPGGQQLASTTYHLEPGEETYLCWGFKSPIDRAVAITRLEAISGTGTHHMGLFKSVVEEPAGPVECRDLLRLTWQPIWGVGTGEPSLDLPAGAAFKLDPGSNYLLQIHLQNASDQVIEGRSGINIQYAPDHRIAELQPAGMFALGSFAISIPPATTDHVVTSQCTLDRAMNVFAVFPHMHKLGTRIHVERGVGGAQPTELFTLDPWTFNEQPMKTVDWQLQPGDTMRTTCHYDNPGGDTIGYGESSDDEMCFFLLFDYPQTELDGCIAG